MLDAAARRCRDRQAAQREVEADSYGARSWRQPARVRRGPARRRRACPGAACCTSGGRPRSSSSSPTAGWRPGDMLPSYTELAEPAGVSLITVRRALDELERAGRVRRHQGLGTFVARPRIVTEPTRAGSLLATLASRRRGDAARSCGHPVLGLDQGLPSADLCQRAADLPRQPGVAAAQAAPARRPARGARDLGHPRRAGARAGRAGRTAPGSLYDLLGRPSTTWSTPTRSSTSRCSRRPRRRPGCSSCPRGPRWCGSAG